MILTNDQIVEAQEGGGITIDPFDPNQVQAATYDLRVGAQGATTSTKTLIDLEKAGYMTLEPGDFGVVTCFETIRLSPQYAARFGLRAKYARKGLVATTGPQIDPGYYGRLIVGITNLTPKPVSLQFKSDFVSVEFHHLEKPSTKPYNGPYQNKVTLGEDEIEFITETEGMALSEMLTTLRSLTQNVGALTTQMGTFERVLESRMKAFEWIIGIGLGFVALAVGVISVITALKH
jgi:dCTP deaminase